MGLIFAPAMNTATLGVDPGDAGVASAMVNTAQQVGGSVGTALLSTIAATAASLVCGRLAGPAGPRRGRRAQLHDCVLVVSRRLRGRRGDLVPAAQPGYPPGARAARRARAGPLTTDELVPVVSPSPDRLPAQKPSVRSSGGGFSFRRSSARVRLSAARLSSPAPAPHVLGVELDVAAARFSSRWATEVVPGISSIRSVRAAARPARSASASRRAARRRRRSPGRRRAPAGRP